MDIKILHPSKDEDILLQVIDLADKNSKTLGFLPKPIFAEQAKNRKIMVALDNRKLAGYLLFRISRQTAHIVHFCISDEYRGKKVAEQNSQYNYFYQVIMGRSIV